MQKIVVKNEDKRTASDSGAADDRRVTLVFPATSDEYKQARAEVESCPQAASEARTGDRGGDERVTPAGEERAATAEPPAGGYYVVTTDGQRRAWGLPDLEHGTAAPDTAPGDPDTRETPEPVPVMDPDEAIELLFGDGASPAADPALVNGAVGEIFADAIEGRRRGRAGPGPVVNLKHDRGPIPASVHGTFRELCRQPRIDGLLESLDELIEPLERLVAPGLEAAGREIAALRRREVTPERLGETGSPDAADERTERVARTCWTIQRRLRKIGEPLGRLDFAGMKTTPSPSAFRRFLEQVEEDPAGNMPEEGLVARCDEALRGFERAAGEAVRRIRAVADARRQVERDAWNDTALRRIRHVLQRVEEAQQALDDDTQPNEKFEVVREGLKEEEQHAAGRLEAEARDVLGQLEAADLPVDVLTRALDELRLAQTLGNEAGAVSLERLRLLGALPWTARAPERVDVEAAMAELEAAHAGRPEAKTRIRRFLATRQLNSATWTVEGRAGGSCVRDPAAPAALRRLVVRPPRSAKRAPVLCFAGPPGGGKTSLAKLIARALRRPAVLVALGGVWDETAIRGLPTTFRTPEAGRIVQALEEAGVRNPVIILDEIDKVGGRTHNHGDPSAALLELLDPEQNTRFRDVYLDVPFDLSEVLFIATANDLAVIPAPLRDRLEVIEAPGYTDDEKVDIVRRTLWRDQLEVAGLSATDFWTRTPTAGHPAGPETGRRVTVEVLDGETAAVSRPGSIEMTDAAVLAVIRCHTCEAGVRQLARRLGAICQFVACRGVETGDTTPVTIVAAAAEEGARLEPARRHLTVAEVLGPPRYDSLPDHVRDALSRERDHILGLHPADPAATAAQAWIEVMEAVPWRRAPAGPLDTPRVLRRTLDREHVGRDHEKDQALDYLVSRHAAAERRAAGLPAGAATVLCLVGPTGIGRTAFARALAAALGRRFLRVSLAGVENPAAVHGAARTAPEAGPGRLVSALRRLGPVPGRAGDNPLVLLGELDRVGEAAADALLGALDPARNRAFRDRYLGLPLDLTGVLFVAAATDPGRIPPLLRERLEPLPLAGYDDEEKHRIATLHLIRQRLAQHGLSPDELSFSPAVLRLLIRGYAREPGVRLLDDRIDTLSRRAARLRADGSSPPGEMKPETVTRWLGVPRFRDQELAGRTPRPGVALGLGVTPSGGDVVVVEATRLPGGGSLRITGTVGPKLTESAQVALTWVRANAGRFASLHASFDDAFDLLHVHLPRAGRSKDGASAGVTVAAAIVSALTGRPVRRDVAMTGELTLGGQVEPVAGIREKVLAACRSGMATVVLPAANAPDVVDSFGDELPGGITARYATTMDDVIEVVLPDVVSTPRMAAASTSPRRG